MSTKNQTVAALALALGLIAPLAAQAAPAMREVRDPITGEMRAPNAAETAAFEKAEAALRARNGKAAAPRAPVQVRYPDGTVEMKLDEDTMMYSVVSANEDGTLTMDCLPAKQAREFIKATKKPAAAKAAAKAGHDHH